MLHFFRPLASQEQLQECLQEDAALPTSVSLLLPLILQLYDAWNVTGRRSLD